MWKIPFFLEMKTSVSTNVQDKNKLSIFQLHCIRNKHMIEENIVYIPPMGRSKIEYASLMATFYLP